MLKASARKSFVSEPAARPILLLGADALAAGNWLAAWFVGKGFAYFIGVFSIVVSLAGDFDGQAFGAEAASAADGAGRGGHVFH